MFDGKNFYFLVYVDLGNGATDNLMMAFSFAGTSTSRIWEIKVSQIECNNLNRFQLTILSCKMCSLNLDKILKKWANLIILLGSKLEYQNIWRQFFVRNSKSNVVSQNLTVINLKIYIFTFYSRRKYFF